MAQRRPICWIEEAEARHIILCETEANKADSTVALQQQSSPSNRRGGLARLLCLFVVEPISRRRRVAADDAIDVAATAA